MTEHEQRDAWLKTLAAGDPVIVHYGRGVGASYHLGTVERTTATQIIVKAETFREPLRLNRDQGRGLGDKRYLMSIDKPTPKRVEAIQRVRLIEEIERTTWKNLSTQGLVAVSSIIRNDEPRD